MSIHQNVSMSKCLNMGLAAVCSMILLGCGGGGGGSAIQARTQSITFADTPTMTLLTAGGIATGSAMVAATASSGLALSYSSMTPDVCTVNKQTGQVTINSKITANTTKGCKIAADQYGDDVYAPVRQELLIDVYIDPSQSISFAAAHTLSLYSVTTVSASASSGLAVSYGSATPTVCSVDASTGLVTVLSAGDCTISAHQAGDSNFHAAANVTQTMSVSIPANITVPSQPTQVSATLGTLPNTVKVSIGAIDSGGSPITGYVVTSSPAGLTASDTSSSITISCGSSCKGYAFSVIAQNAQGDSPPSAVVDVLTSYAIVETFYEPATQPNDSIFTGTFTFNSTRQTVTDLAGSLTESMTGGSNSLTGGASSTGSHYGDVPMTLVQLSHQLSVQQVTLDGVPGLLVTTFALPSTDTFLKGGIGSLPVNDGWSPDVGVDVGGIYFGFPTAPNPFNGGVGNAYAMIFVNTDDPTTPLSQAQINRLAYADCTAGGMMGAACMTGTAAAGYTGSGSGHAGTMGGYPKSQIITRVP